MNIEVKNICNDFLKFWEEAEKVETLEEKKLLWDKLYEGPNKDIFDIYYRAFGYRADLDDCIMRKYPEAIEKIKNVNSVIEEKISEVSKKCSEIFNTYNMDFNYVIMVGSFTSNGWGTTYNSKPTVFFAIEFENDPNYFDVFLAHEITHNFHMNINSKRVDCLADSTLAEGLAVVASRELYPGFSDTEYLNFGLKGEEWLKKCREVFKSIKNEYIENLENDDFELQKKYFFGKISEDKEIPNRIGYVIGYDIVSALIKKYSFYELASWSLEKTITEVRAELKLL